MGGGANRHFDLIISTNSYQTIAPNYPYILPVLPRMLSNNVGPTSVVTETLRLYNITIIFLQEDDQVKCTIVKKILKPSTKLS